MVGGSPLTPAANPQGPDPAGAARPTAPAVGRAPVVAVGRAAVAKAAVAKAAVVKVAMPRVARRRKAGQPRDVHQHRRRWSRIAWRRLELLAWAAAAGVVLAMGLLVTHVVPAPAWHLGSDPGVVRRLTIPYSTSICAFESCSQPAPTGEPTMLRIPSIGVLTPLDVLGLDRQGRLEAPTSFDRAGWFGGGVVPGDAGPAVIAGHVDSTTGAAVFYRLQNLRPGDIVEVRRGTQWLTFRVTATRKYRKSQFPTDEVYAPTPDPELRLITCGGAFDDVRGSYLDDVVVYAVAVS